MTRGKILIIAVIGVLVAGLAILMVTGNRINQTVSPLGKAGKATTSDLPITYLTHQDSSGFRFDYPDTLVATVPAKLTDNLYGEVNLTSKKYPGSINIIAQTTTAKDLHDWLTTQKIDPKQTPFKQLKLADLEAQQYATAGATITIALDRGAAFIIKLEAKNNPAYWITGYNKILTSFAFVNPETNQENTNITTTIDDAGTAGAVELEGEEVIE